MAGGRLWNEETFWCKRIIKFLRRRLLGFENLEIIKKNDARVIYDVVLRDRERARTGTIDNWELLSLYLVNSVQSNTGIKLTCCWVFAGYRFCSLGFSLTDSGGGKRPWLRLVIRFSKSLKILDVINVKMWRCGIIPKQAGRIARFWFFCAAALFYGGAVPCHHGGSWAAASTGLIEYLTCRHSVSVFLKTGNFVNSEKHDEGLWVIRFWAVDRGWVVKFLATHGGMSHFLWQELAPISDTRQLLPVPKDESVSSRSLKSRCGWCTILFHVLWSLYEDSSLKSNRMSKESQGKNFPKYCPSKNSKLAYIGICP